MMPSIFDLMRAQQAARHQPQTTTPAPLPAPPAGGGTPYGLAALNQETTRVATAPQGTRNDTLNRAAYNLAQLVAGGQIDPGLVYDRLHQAATVAGLPPSEIASTLRSGGTAGRTQPRQPDEAWQPTTPPPVTVLDDHMPPSGQETSGHADSDTDAGSEPPSQEDKDAAYQAWRDAQVAAEAERLRIRADAQAIITREREEAAWAFPDYLPTLTDELALPDEKIEYLIDDVFPVDSNVLLTAQYKSGKTTMMLNLIRALADRTKFLDALDTHMGDGERIVFLNYEVGRGMIRRWMRQEHITRTDDVTVITIRGHEMPIMGSRGFAELTGALRRASCRVLVVDPYARAFVGNGQDENDNSQAGAFLDRWDQVKEAAGVRELVMVTHTGRDSAWGGKVRARGATRVDDWADVRWALTVDPDTDRRFLSASGRDVEWPEHEITYDAQTRRLGVGWLDRKASRRASQEDEVVRVVQDQPGISQAGILMALHASQSGLRKADLPALLEAARGHLRIYSQPGPKRSKLWYPTTEGK